MSTINVKVVKLNITPHENAEKLELATIGGEGGFTAVVGKGQFKNGDLAIFIPENSVVPEKIREFLTTTQKIEVKDGRIRCAKIRGVFSDGLCLTPNVWLTSDMIKEDQDVTKYLGITKYEPPLPSTKGMGLKSKGVNYQYVNTNFKEYTDIENFKKHPRIFKEGEEVVVTIKYHGSNWRAAIVEKPNFTLFEKAKRFFGLTIEEMEYLVGSHYRIKKRGKKGKLVEDKFIELAQKYDVENVLKYIQDFSTIGKLTARPSKTPEVAMYGELIGYGVQTGYNYGLKEGEQDLKVFDLMVGRQYQDWDKLVWLLNIWKIPVVDVIYRGPWSLDVLKLAEGVDEYNGQKYVREGIVIKPVKERRDPHTGRVVLKYISETFRLDKKNSEYH